MSVHKQTQVSTHSWRFPQFHYSYMGILVRGATSETEAMNPQESFATLARPAFSPIKPDDHAGQVWILTTLAVIYTGATLIVRCSIKWNLFWLDDYLLAIATVSLSPVSRELNSCRYLTFSGHPLHASWSCLLRPEPRTRQVQLHHYRASVGAVREGILHLRGLGRCSTCSGEVLSMGTLTADICRRWRF